MSQHLCLLCALTIVLGGCAGASSTDAPAASTEQPVVSEAVEGRTCPEGTVLRGTHCYQPLGACEPQPTLTKEEITLRIRENFPGIASCARGSERLGKLRTRFFVTGKTGTVSRVELMDAEWEGTNAGECLREFFREFRTCPFDKDEQKITYPFVIN